MKEEILKTFDLFIENANTKELKELIKDIKEMYDENERLRSIIKEVREYIEENMGYYSSRLEHQEYIDRYVNDLNKIMKLLYKEDNVG